MHCFVECPKGLIPCPLFPNQCHPAEARSLRPSPVVRVIRTTEQSPLPRATTFLVKLTVGLVSEGLNKLFNPQVY